MKKEINPAVAGVVVVVIVLIIGVFLYMKTSGAEGGARPSSESLSTLPSGKKLPSAVGTSTDKK